MKGYSQKGVSPRCILNVDLQKAYDSVSWEFVRYALRQVKLADRFIALVMECVTTPTYSVIINGALEGFFKGGRAIPICNMYGYAW